jgi:hypothetical protein
MTIIIEPALGSIVNFPNQKTLYLDIVTKNKAAATVEIAGQNVPACINGSIQAPCFEQLSNALVRIHGGPFGVRLGTEVRVGFSDRVSSSAWAQLVCREGFTNPGTSVYIIGDDPVLGAWNPERAVPLKPSAYPVWSGSVHGLEAGKIYQWKCIKRSESSAVVEQWESGSNHRLQAVQGFSGLHRGSF